MTHLPDFRQPRIARPVIPAKAFLECDRHLAIRRCEERSDEAIQRASGTLLDGFAPLAMTEDIT
jgi:hypothetical protein